VAQPEQGTCDTGPSLEAEGIPLSGTELVGGESTAEIEQNIIDAATGIRDSWLLWQPTIPGNSTVRGRSGSGDPAMVIAASIRRESCEEMVGWVRLIMDERDPDVSLSGNDMPAMCAVVIRNARWLSGHEAAPDMVSELEGIARRLTGILPRGRSTRIYIGRCPACHADVHADTDLPNVSCGSCEKEGSWRQWEEWTLGPRDLVTSPLLADFIRQAVGISVTGVTVWRWIKAEAIKPAGHAQSAIGVAAGTALYDPWDAVEYALTRSRAAGAA